MRRNHEESNRSSFQSQGFGPERSPLHTAAYEPLRRSRFPRDSAQNDRCGNRRREEERLDRGRWGRRSGRGAGVLQRMDGTQTGSSDIAIEKARAAVAFKRSTKLFEEGIAEGRLQNLGLPGALPIEGGVPLIVDGRIVGAIGVSGARPDQDGVCVKAAIDALA